MTHQIFADGVGTISVTGGVVRIELITVLPNERDAQGQMATRVQGTLVMPLEGYLRATTSLQQGIQELIKAGMVKVNPPGEATGAAANPVTVGPAVTTIN